MTTPLLIARGTTDIYLLPQMANRHGLIAGATGTGKTVSLQMMAEALSGAGVPVFMADVKGDLAGLSQPGGGNAKVDDRLKTLKLEDFAFAPSPVMFWDVFGNAGHPVRATISEMGPLLLGRIMDLNDVQQGVLTITFKVADDNGLLLLDLKDLRAMVQYVGENAKQLTSQYGNVSSASIGAIQRALLQIEQQSGTSFFGEPALNFDDWLQSEGRKGYINILAADKLMQAPRLYATFLLWMLSELYERLPEVGDIDKPKLVFFFDEAHLLFDDAPDSLLQKIEQVVRLVRSKGVGVYFVTQNPLDVPDVILGQLGNRIQHALRAFTPRDQKAVSAAAETFRPNPKIDVSQAITELGVGEALVSFLDEKGTPGVVERAFIIPPHSHIGAITPEQRKAIIDSSIVAGQYEKAVDRESAYEMLKARAATPQSQPQAAPAPQPQSNGGIFGSIFGSSTPAKGRQREGVGEAMIKSAVRAAGSQIGRQIVRGVLGSILGTSRR